MPAAEPRLRTPGADWTMTALMLAGLGVCIASLSSLLVGVVWWFAVMFEAVVVLLAAAIVRSFAKRAFWGTVAAAIAAVLSMTLLFVPQTALLAVVPTLDSLEAFRVLEQEGGGSISSQSIPANADQGILYLLCLGVVILAVVMDALAFVARTPAFVGIPLLVLLLVPSFVDPSFDDGFFFALAAAVYVGILLVRSRRPGRGAALGLASVAVVAALVVPLALPAVESPAPGNGQQGNLATGVNPIITLGDDLRRGDPSLALTYTTTAERGQYLRLTALDDFSGQSWEPTVTTVVPENEVSAIGAAPGLVDAVPRTEETTEVTVGRIASRWLPAPYAPVSVAGLVGVWAWEPDGLAIRTNRSNARGQQYTVTSLGIAPSIEQLRASGTTVQPGLERYLEIPVELPEVVGDTAATVTAGAETNYDKAIALQDYFRGGDFVYSEDAPVDNDYDGSGASVLESFLSEKAGYCVHFSSAMAAMARTLGIPARVAVGFTAGQAVTNDEGVVEYRVTTHDLHAWPELFFADVGWVRFEPTPGRGNPPEFAPLAQDDPATPDVDESVPAPVNTAVPSNTPTAAPPIDDEPTTAPDDSATGATGVAIPWWVGVLAGAIVLLLVPFLIRSITRARRLRAATAGSAAAGWDEIRDTVDDLGIPTSDTRTPRQFASDLDEYLDPRGRQALARLLAALEAQVFASRSGGPDPQDVRTVLAALRRSAGPGRTLLATFAPRSLFAGLLPAPAEV